jgi:8-oxo-dGTP diphosphatase
MTIRVADAIIIKDQKVMLVQQAKKSAYQLWSFPGGRVEDGETPLQAVRREVYEELGVKPVKVDSVGVYEIDGPTAKLELHTFRVEIGGDISLKADELLDHSFFSLDEMRALGDQLRHPILLQQAQAAIT